MLKRNGTSILMIIFSEVNEYNLSHFKDSAFRTSMQLVFNKSTYEVTYLYLFLLLIFYHQIIEEYLKTQ